MRPGSFDDMLVRKEAAVSSHSFAPPTPHRLAPLVPLWMLAGLAAAVLGATAPEPGRRGLLVLPFMLGALVLVVWIAEAIIPH